MTVTPETRTTLYDHKYIHPSGKPLKNIEQYYIICTFVLKLYMIMSGNLYNSTAKTALYTLMFSGSGPGYIVLISQRPFKPTVPKIILTRGEKVISGST